MGINKIVIVLIILFSLCSCKSIDFGRKNDLLSYANKELYKKTASKKEFKNVFQHIFDIREKYASDNKLTGMVFFIHSEAIVHGSTRVISTFVNEKEKLTYYSDLFDKNKFEKHENNLELCVVDNAIKYLKEKKVEDFKSLSKESNSQINHSSTYYITVIDFSKREIIANLIVDEFCDELKTGQNNG